MRRVKREKENLTAVETFESNQARPLLLVLNFWYSLLEIWQLSNGQQLESTLVSSSSWPLHSSADDLRLSLIGSNFKFFTLPQSILSLSLSHSFTTQFGVCKRRENKREHYWNWNWNTALVVCHWYSDSRLAVWVLVRVLVKIDLISFELECFKWNKREKEPVEMESAPD